jgi:hypothetical protein
MTSVPANSSIKLNVPTVLNTTDTLRVYSDAVGVTAHVTGASS